MQALYLYLYKLPIVQMLVLMVTTPTETFFPLRRGNFLNMIGSIAFF